MPHLQPVQLRRVVPQRPGGLLSRAVLLPRALPPHLVVTLPLLAQLRPAVLLSLAVQLHLAAGFRRVPLQHLEVLLTLAAVRCPLPAPHLLVAEQHRVL